MSIHLVSTVRTSEVLVNSPAVEAGDRSYKEVVKEATSAHPGANVRFERPGVILDGEDSPVAFAGDWKHQERQVAVLTAPRSLFVSTAEALGSKATPQAVNEALRVSARTLHPKLYGYDRVIILKRDDDA